MAAVSNSSPLILYAKVRRLDLLRALFGEILIPDAVHREVVEQGAGRPGASDVASAPWIRRSAIPAPLTGSAATEPVLTTLGPGEAAAIALARHLTLPVLLDDLAGRHAAIRLGLAVVGSAGAAVLAKNHGHVTAARPVLDALRAAGLHLNAPVYQRLLERAGEAG